MCVSLCTCLVCIHVYACVERHAVCCVCVWYTNPSVWGVHLCVLTLIGKPEEEDVCLLSSFSNLLSLCLFLCLCFCLFLSPTPTHLNRRLPILLASLAGQQASKIHLFVPSSSGVVRTLSHDWLQSLLAVYFETVSLSYAAGLELSP